VQLAELSQRAIQLSTMHVVITNPRCRMSSCSSLFVCMHATPLLAIPRCRERVVCAAGVTQGRASRHCPAGVDWQNRFERKQQQFQR